MDNSNNVDELPTEVSELVIDMLNFRIFQYKENSAKKKSHLFIPIYFQGKDIEKLGLGSIFRSFSQLFPSNNGEKNIPPPIIIYKR